MYDLFFRRLRILPALLVLGASGLVFLPSPARAAKARMLDLADTVFTNRIMTKFALLLQASDLASFLSSRGPFTLFVPTNSAFSRILPDQFALLMQPQNQDVLQRIILFHVVNGREIFAHDMAALKSLPSCEGNPLPLKVARTGYQMVGKAKILHADIHAATGLLDEIDTVLLPPGVSLAKLAAPPAPPPAANAMASPAPPSTNDTPASGGDTGPMQVAPSTNAGGTTNLSPPMQ